MMVMPAQIDLEKENLALRDELKRARIELRRTDQMKRNFVALAAHELRSPLAIILGYAKILETETSGPAHERAEIVTTHAWQLKNVVDTMLTLQQLDAGELRLRLEPLDLAPAIQNVIASRQREIAEKPLTVETRIAPDLRVRADRERLELILACLLSNAIKYSSAGGNITIQALAETSRVLVS